MSANKRIFLIDLTRFLAIVFMVIFHFFYDLSIFRYVKINFQKDLFWWTFPRFIVFLFLLSMGMSVVKAHPLEIRWDSFKKRFFKIVVGAVGVSIATYFLFPDRWIYFGTLHCIALSSLAALPLRKHKWPSLILSFGILAPLTFGFKWPWLELQHKSMDYIPFLPWFGVVCLGIFLAHTPAMDWKPKITEKRPWSFALFASKHSLTIYIIHQPILFGSVWLFSKIIQ